MSASWLFKEEVLSADGATKVTREQNQGGSGAVSKKLGGETGSSHGLCELCAM